MFTYIHNLKHMSQSSKDRLPVNPYPHL